MKQSEFTRDIFIVGGPEITDSRDGCVYLLNFGELILIDTGAGWSLDKIINNINKLGFDCNNLKKSFLPTVILIILEASQRLKKGLDLRSISINWMLLLWRVEIRF